MKNKVREFKSGIKGNESRPRLSVFRSNDHIYAQVINDEKGETLVSASSLSEEGLKSDLVGAKKVGELIGQRAKEKKISKVVFDRGRYVYKGRIKALADSARQAGLEF